MQFVRSEASPVRKRSVIPVWIWVAVASALLFALYNAQEAYVLRVKIAKMQESTAVSMQAQENLRSQLLETKRQAMILTDPKSHAFVFAAREKEWPQMKAVWNAEYGLCVMGHKIPLPKANRTLELWLLPMTRGSKPIPVTTLPPDPSGNFYLVVAHPPEDIRDTRWLAITEEPAGGSAQPTSAPLWMAPIS
jgi:Anti-sigma-K factor rskA, C-terminal